MKSSKRLQNFARDSEVAIGRATKYDNLYNKVFILAFYWANDEMQTVTLESQLLGIATEVYVYEPEFFTISVAQFTQCLSDKLFEWSKICREKGTLSINFRPLDQKHRSALGQAL